MTQNQLEWMQQSGLDPAEYDMTPDGRVVRRQPAQPVQPIQQKMSPLRAAGTSFLGNVLPSAASLGAGAYLAPLALSNPWTGIPTVIAGSLAAGYGTGKLQEKALEEFAPEALQQMAQAEQDQPVASYLGGFAPNALALKPSFGGIKGLTAPLGSMSKDAARAAFLPAAANVGVNVAGSTAGQLINMSQGGEFSAPRFAADVALGSLFADPTKLGRRFGLTPLKPDVAAAESTMDLAALRTAAAESSEAARVAGEAEAARIMDETRGQMAAGGMTAREVELFKTRPEMEWWKQPEATRIADIERTAKQVKQKLPKGMVAELAGLPEVYDAVQNPEKFPQFLANSLEEALNAAHERGVQDRFLRPEDAEIMGRYQDNRLEVMAQKEALKPTPEEAAKAEAIQAENARIEAEQNAAELRKLQDLEAAQALSDEAAERLQVLKSRRAELLYANRGERPNIRQNIREQSDPAITQAKQELADARAIADDLYSRLQRPGGEGLLSQADLDAAAQLAAQRGLKIVPAPPEQQARGIRGAYVVNQNGERVVYINPLAATADTAIHEIGHDVFKTSPNERMKRSLMDTAEGSEAYRREYEARLAEGKTEQVARDLALEEGLVQAFGEAYPKAKPGEIRQWFNALKSSVKSMIGMKLSPEDALAWMHYATTEAVPWKGVAVAKTGGAEERFSRAKELSRRIEVDDIDWATMSDRDFQRTVNLEDLLNSVIPELKIYQEKPNVFREDVVISREPRLMLDREAWGKAILTGDRTEGHVLIDAGLWDNALDNLPGAREKFLQVLKHELGHIDDAPNVGEYGSARDERVADEFAARYQRAQQETPAFKNWFGESKVVDADGKPLVVYHGTDAPDFTEFRTKTGYNFGPGAYFTPEPPRAAEYARTSTGSRIYPVYVSLENPYRVTSDATLQDIGYKIRKDPANAPLLKQLMDKYDARNSDILGNGEIGNAWLREQGYDGIIKERQRYTENGFVPEIVEVVAFKPEQVKSALGNRGTFSPLSKDIRYQRGLGSEIVRPSELDYLASKGGPFADVATNVKAAYNTRDFKAGEWANKYSLAAQLRPEDQKRLFTHLSQEFDNNTRSTPPADLRAAYDQIRNDYLPAIVNDYNAAGMTVRDTAGLRARGSNPTYIPLHAIAEEVKNILTTKQGSPEYDKLKNDFLQWNTQLRQADGASLAEAQKYALEKFEEKINITSKPPGIESGIPFSGARKPEGYPLPPSWRSDDLIGNLNNYTRRSATDYAYQQHVESSPEAMAALGAKKYFNDQPIPANILASTANVINDPSVQSILREYRGTPAQKVGGNLTDLGKAVSVATIGPVSKVGDIGTSLVKGLVYMPAGEYTSGLVDFTNRLGDWAALKERSYASGLNKRDAAQNMRQVLGIGDDSVSFMAKAAETLSKFTGLNQLETVARTIAQGWGETVVKYNKRLALSGDKNATQMLDTLSPDWRTRSDADLAAQVGRLLQGSYDMRQLPASVLEGAAAPYLTWSKWSIGQYDSFMKYALQPAMQGNVKPLIGQMLIGVLGGGAVSAVQEWINNREGKDITWNELESWMQQNQGQLGADGGQLLGQKLLTMAQKLGTFGFAGDVAKMVIDTAAGGTAQGVATMPALDAIYDVSKRVAAATKALDDGEDFGLVLKALAQDSVIGHLQVARLARNWLDEDENLRYDDRRRRRLYDELTGMPSRGGAFAVNYSNLSEREFERGEITPQTGEEALGLVTRAREQATTPEDYASRIRKLKTAQNAIMPSLERQPLKAARYLSWLEGTEEGLGSETMRRYLIREQEDKYRKSLIEGMSGLR